MATRKKASTETSDLAAGTTKTPIKDKVVTCGLVMPISALDGCTADHWAEVKGIVTECIESLGEPKFAVRLVSDADDVGVIQKRIVQNIYSSDVVVCDVSGKNPNVMFELGMRLAFDKPTVIIKDDKTDYAFDTGIIEHVAYPRDLRFNRIVAFKASLIDKVLATHKAAAKDPNHSTFLKNFGKFQVATLSEAEVPVDRLVLETLQELQMEVSRMRHGSLRESSRSTPAESAAALASAFVRYQGDNPNCVAADLVGQDGFYRFMERTMEAPRHYSSKRTFEAAVDEFLKQLVSRDDKRE